MLYKCSVEVIYRHNLHISFSGKSALCRKIASQLNYAHPEVFVESSGVESETRGTLAVEIRDLMIRDTCGLLDTTGVAQDEINIASIAQAVRQDEYVNAIILVLNEQACRFDDGMQCAVKLLVDSFGPGCLGNLGIVFTKANGFVTAEKSRETAAGIARCISRRTGVPSEFIPSWQVDSHPEHLARLRVPQDVIMEQTRLSEQAVDDMLRWIRTKPRYSTKDAVAAEYEQRAEAKRQEQLRLVADQARQAAEANAAAANERARQAEAAAAAARNNGGGGTFLNSHGFKIGGKRIW